MWIRLISARLKRPRERRRHDVHAQLRDVGDGWRQGGGDGACDGDGDVVDDVEQVQRHPM